MKTSYRITAVVITLGMLWLFLTGCQNETIQEPLAVDEDEDSATVITMVDTVEVKGRDGRMRFSASLPDGWTLIDFSGERPEAQFVYAKTPEDIKLDSFVISIVIQNAHMSPEQVLRMYVKEEDEGKVADVDIDGIAGWTFIRERLSNRSQYILLPEKGHAIEITVSPPEAMEDPAVRAILNSLQFHIAE